MRVGKAAKLLGVSRVTVHNWLRSGVLRASRVLPNGYVDLDEASVYEAAERAYAPEGGGARVVVFPGGGRPPAAFRATAEAAERVAAYLAELEKASPPE